MSAFRGEEEALRAQLKFATEREREARDESAAMREELQELRRSSLAARARRGLEYAKHAMAFAFGAALAVGIVVAGIRSCEAALPSDAHGVVTDRYHRDAYTTTSCQSIGKIVVCNPVHHPATWSLRVAHDGHERVDFVSEDEWSRTAIGDRR